MYIDSIIIVLSGLVILLILQFYIYKIYGSIELCYAVSSFLICIYVLTIFPGGSSLKSVPTIVLSAMFTLIFVNKFNLESVFFYKTSEFKSDKLIIFIFIVLFFISVFIINIKDILNQFGISKILLFLLCPVFYCLYFPEVYFNKPQIIKFLLKFFIILGTITGFIGIIFYYFSINQNPSVLNASSAYFVHPNTAAFVYSFSAPVVIYLLLFEKYRFSKPEIMTMIFSLIIIYAGLILTISRAGYLAIFISSFILVYFKNKKLLLLFLILFGTFFYLFLQGFVFSKGSVSSVSRLGLIYSAIELLKSSREGFLWGFGTISVFDIYSDYKLQLGPLIEDVPYPHNFILFFIMQFGVLSLIFLLIYLIKLIYSTIRTLNNTPEKNKFLILPLAVVVSLLFQSLLEDTILFPDYFVFHFFLIFFGFIVYFKYIKKSEIELTF